MQFRSANTLPRDLSLFTAPDGQIYLASAPSPEVDTLRGRLVRSAGKTSLSERPREYRLPQANDGICEIVAELAPKAGSAVTMTLSNVQGNKVVLTYDEKARTLSFDRRESGITDFSQDFPAVTVAPVIGSDAKLSLRIFVDRSSIEVFGNDGRLVMTNLVFPESPYTTLSVSSAGKAAMQSLAIYSLTPAASR